MLILLQFVRFVLKSPKETRVGEGEKSIEVASTPMPNLVYSG
jgi:hypothetical protein